MKVLRFLIGCAVVFQSSEQLTVRDGVYSDE